MAAIFVGNHQDRVLGNSTNEYARVRQNDRMQGQSEHKMKNGSIFAGNLNQQDSLMQRKNLAMKKAMKVVSDAWLGDKKIDQNMEESRQHIKDSQKLMADNNEIIKGYNERKEELRGEYGVEADSQEQKDLELMEKQKYAMRHPNEVRLTKEEEQRLKELEGQPLTEYQQRALEIDTAISVYQAEIDEAKEEISAESAALRAIRVERLKSDPMADAQKEADEIRQSASEEAISSLVGEATDHITEELEKEREEAKEKEEEKEEQEEKLEEEREEKEIKQEQLTLEQEQKRIEEEKRQSEQKANARGQEELLENAAAYAEGSLQDASQVQTEIKDMLHKMKLLEEDIKGAEVDVEL